MFLIEISNRDLFSVNWHEMQQENERDVDSDEERG